GPKDLSGSLSVYVESAQPSPIQPTYTTPTAITKGGTPTISAQVYLESLGPLPPPPPPPVHAECKDYSLDQCSGSVSVKNTDGLICELKTIGTPPTQVCTEQLR